MLRLQGPAVPLSCRRAGSGVPAVEQEEGARERGGWAGPSSQPAGGHQSAQTVCSTAQWGCATCLSPFGGRVRAPWRQGTPHPPPLWSFRVPWGFWLGIRASWGSHPAPGTRPRATAWISACSPAPASQVPSFMEQSAGRKGQAMHANTELEAPARWRASGRQRSADRDPTPPCPRAGKG